MTCIPCEKAEKRIIYIGETSRSACERLYEHMNMFKRKVEGDPEKNQNNSVFWNHSKDHHNGHLKTSDWKVEIVSAHRTALNRQVTEAVRIAQANNSEILNSKM